MLPCKSWLCASAREVRLTGGVVVGELAPAGAEATLIGRTKPHLPPIFDDLGGHAKPFHIHQVADPGTAGPILGAGQALRRLVSILHV